MTHEKIFNQLAVRVLRPDGKSTIGTEIRMSINKKECTL